jgi:hypothetical protein
MEPDVSLLCSPALVFIPSKINPVHILPPYILKDHFNIINLFPSRSSNSSRGRHVYSACTLDLSYFCTTGCANPPSYNTCSIRTRTLGTNSMEIGNSMVFMLLVAFNSTYQTEVNEACSLWWQTCSKLNVTV